MRRPCSSLNSRSCCLRRASLVAAALVSRASADVVQGLGSADGAYAWTLRNANGSLAVPATVPGAALLDLVRAGLAPEPYAGTNVDALGWVKREAWWTWTLEFDAEPALLGSARVELVAEGVDTVADVTFNGEELWVQDSAFVRTVVDVTATLRAAGNVLSIRIFSPTAAALAANASCAGYCPSAEWGPVTNRSGYDQAFQYLRKAGCHFGWDFAPNLAPSGVWRSIILRGYDGATLDDVSVVTAPAGGGVVPLGDGGSPWTAVVTAHVVVVPPAGSGTVGVTVTVAVTGLPGGHGSTHAVLAAGARDVAVSLALPSARAWWPAGVGAPALYPANVTVVVDGAAPGARGTSARALDLAFRTVAVRRPAVPGGNASALMFFEVRRAG